MTDIIELRERKILNAIRLGLSGLCLILIAFFAPYAGQQEGKSFFQIARAASWHNGGDWQAAWCSFKIILVILGIVFLIESLARLMMAYRRETLSWMFSLLNIIPGLALLLGSYYLLRAVF